MCSSNQFFVSDYMDVDKIPDNRHFQPLTFVTEVKWNDGKTYYVFALCIYQAACSAVVE